MGAGLPAELAGLALVIKAKLEAVEAGITTFDEEFLAHIVMPGGHSIGQFVIPRLEEVYRTGQAALLLPGPAKAQRSKG